MNHLYISRILKGIKKSLSLFIIHPFFVYFVIRDEVKIFSKKKKKSSRVVGSYHSAKKKKNYSTNPKLIENRLKMTKALWLLEKKIFLWWSRANKRKTLYFFWEILNFLFGKDFDFFVTCPSSFFLLIF